MNTDPIKTEINRVEECTEKAIEAFPCDQLFEGEPHNCSKGNSKVLRKLGENIFLFCATYRNRRAFYMDVLD
jgi:hypothetical protein